MPASDISACVLAWADTPETRRAGSSNRSNSDSVVGLAMVIVVIVVVVLLLVVMAVVVVRHHTDLSQQPHKASALALMWLRVC
jgi:heme/copper-type cytochrome/quinol oxidase subunit 2